MRIPMLPFFCINRNWQHFPMVTMLCAKGQRSPLVCIGEGHTVLEKMSSNSELFLLFSKSSIRKGPMLEIAGDRLTVLKHKNWNNQSAAIFVPEKSAVFFFLVKSNAKRQNCAKQCGNWYSSLEAVHMLPYFKFSSYTLSLGQKCDGGIYIKLRGA